MRCITLSLVIALLVVGSGIAQASEAATPMPPVRARKFPPSVPSTATTGCWRPDSDENVGRDQKWFEHPRGGQADQGAWIIQDAFPGYHGVAWYWRTFTHRPIRMPVAATCCDFWAVDYLAEVWLNGKQRGRARGG